MKTTPYRFVGDRVADLHDGRALVPGETYELSDDELAEPHNRRYIDAGLLLDASPPPKAPQSGHGSRGGDS